MEKATNIYQLIEQWVENGKLSVQDSMNAYKLIGKKLEQLSTAESIRIGKEVQIRKGGLTNGIYNLEMLTEGVISELSKQPGMTRLRIATEMGISERTLYRYMKQLKIELK